MLQIPNPDEEEFLGSLRKRADSVTPPPSLSPDAIKKQLPERPKITLTRRLAPFAAAAACPDPDRDLCPEKPRHCHQGAHKRFRQFR